jgi:hypothetical protein
MADIQPRWQASENTSEAVFSPGDWVLGPNTASPALRPLGFSGLVPMEGALEKPRGNLNIDSGDTLRCPASRAA